MGVRYATGDRQLFIKLLGGMLADLQHFMAYSSQGLDDLKYLGSRAHKLKGVAGTLGSTGVAQAAAALEGACTCDNTLAAQIATRNLIEHLQTLSKEVEPWVMTLREDSNSDAHLAAVPLEPRVVHLLLQQLRQSDLAAGQTMEALAPVLKHALDAASFEALRSHIDHLRFAEAADHLERNFVFLQNQFHSEDATAHS